MKLQPRALDRAHERGIYVFVFIVALAIFSNLIFSPLRVRGVTTGNILAFQTVSAGVLEIVSASTSNSFSGVTVTFSSQTSTMPDLGAIRVSDARGSGAGWSLALSATDWKAGQDVMQLDYNGTGSDGNLGKMCLIVASGAIRSQAGQDVTSITRGSLSCFSASVTSLSIYTAASSFGKGNYWITDFDVEQFIPSSPTAQNLTTTLTLTIS